MCVKKALFGIGCSATDFLRLRNKRDNTPTGTLKDRNFYLGISNSWYGVEPPDVLAGAVPACHRVHQGSSPSYGRQDLDCTVQHRPDLGILWCSCHNGRYGLDGTNISGPPPRPLVAYQVKEVGETIFVSKGDS